MKPVLVFLHGWGQSAKVWFAQTEHFSEQFDVHALNLPGHGGASDAVADDWVEVLAKELPQQPAILVGWSLGGIMAMQLALKFPEKVVALALVATTPSFCMREGWASGASPELLEGFRAGAESREAKMLSRFFALMLHGDELPRPAFNRLAREAVDKAHPPSRAGMQAGLEILSETDLRGQIINIDKPVLILHGEQDAIVPFAAGEYLAAHIENAALISFAPCGHAPMLTQAEEFNEKLEAWCRAISIPIK